LLQLFTPWYISIIFEYYINIIYYTLCIPSISTGALFGNANPYCAFSLGSHREKTTVKWGGDDDWIWKNTILSFRTSLSKLQSYSLYVRVYDKERIRRKKLLGGVSIKLSGLEIHGIQSWFALECTSGSTAGEIYLSIQIG
jgi:hypothetical protein